MDLGSNDRSLLTPPAGRGDLAGDVQRKNRRRILKRAAQITALGAALLLAGFGVKHLADQRDRDNVIERVEVQYVQGTVADLVGAVELLSLIHI